MSASGTTATKRTMMSFISRRGAEMAASVSSSSSSSSSSLSSSLKTSCRRTKICPSLNCPRSSSALQPQER